MSRTANPERAPEQAVPAFRVSCDSAVALAPLTSTATTIFAKNSDRPAQECHPLLQMAAADHAAGSALRCQYIEIEQVEHTHAFLGASPYWLWGLEHGVNEFGLAIGNHTIFTKDAVAETGLLGMDLVRLALERAADADQALDVIVSLIERYGQGGSGAVDTVWPYHNSFLIADAGKAWLLEASARHWAAREVQGGASASNHTTIGTNWDRLSADCISHAREMGWWSGSEAERFDFAAAYRDSSTIPAVISSGRHASTCAALDAARAGSPLDTAGFRGLMRDHYGSEVHRPGRSPEEQEYFSVCMHADPVGTTTASMVVELHGDAARPLLYWAALASPCIGPFLPLFFDGCVPKALTQGGAEACDGGAWWGFRRLLAAVEEDPGARAQTVRDFWREFEAALSPEVEAVATGDGVRAAAGSPEAAAALGAFMDDVWKRTESACAEILSRITGG